jgi:hypothetical protein
MVQQDKYGTDWTDDELNIIVAEYFAMLRSELNGLTYNKSAIRRSLVARIGRTEGSVERKNQNISAVLCELALPIISGYKPLPNFQASIIDAIDRYLTVNPENLKPERLIEALNEPSNLYLEPPPDLGPLTHKEKELVRLVRKFDPAERDFRNRSLGKSGEEMVLKFERQNLVSKGRSDLAHQVAWVSQDDDAAGYDIRSFDPEGSVRLLEVKTTNGIQTTPFYLTRNELSFSKERPTEFRICRLYDFSKNPRMFELAPPIDKAVRLEPYTFTASFN